MDISWHLVPEHHPKLHPWAFQERLEIRAAIEERFLLLDQFHNGEAYLNGYTPDGVLEIHRDGHRSLLFPGHSGIQSFVLAHLVHCQSQKVRGFHTLENWQWLEQAPESASLRVAVRYWSQPAGDDWQLKVEGVLDLNMAKIKGKWLTKKQVSKLKPFH